MNSHDTVTFSAIGPDCMRVCASGHGVVTREFFKITYFVVKELRSPCFVLNKL